MDTITQEFEFDIVHRPEVQHAIANYLSQLETGEPTIGVRDDIPNTKLFRIQVDRTEEVQDDIIDSWITDMTIILSTGFPPEGMPLDERKRISVRSRNFHLLKETLYHKGAHGIWRRGIHQFEKPAILREAHCCIVGGHYVGETTTQNME